jgi:uncharacterized protein (TIGR00251 family)
MTTLFPVKDCDEGASFLVRVAPRASRTAVVGLMGEGAEAVVKIALNAPPVEGRANTALIEFLAKLFGTARSAIRIAGGEHARNKRIVVRGRSVAEVATVLETALGATKGAPEIEP